MKAICLLSSSVLTYLALFRYLTFRIFHLLLTVVFPTKHIFGVRQEQELGYSFFEPKVFRSLKITS